MTRQQMQLLYFLSIKDESQEYVEWTIDGIDDAAIMELQDKELVFVSIGEGYVGSLKTISLTPSGQELIKDYCDVCECTPCDCDWGNY